MLSATAFAAAALHPAPAHPAGRASSRLTAAAARNYPRIRRAVMAEDGGGGFDLNAAFAQQLKKSTGTDSPREAKKRTDRLAAAEKRSKEPKNRPGTRLDLANKPQNFFRGLAERDEEAQRRAADGAELEEADLLDADDAKIFAIGFVLIAVFFAFATGFIPDKLDQQAYQKAIDTDNLDLRKCLDYAYSFSEKNICKFKYGN
tara:strand:+ start:121 stop:729 length:609 start_codon:yes stop_codon:yes gene_type:complete